MAKFIKYQIAKLLCVAMLGIIISYHIQVANIDFYSTIVLTFMVLYAILGINFSLFFKARKKWLPIKNHIYSVVNKKIDSMVDNNYWSYKNFINKYKVILFYFWHIGKVKIYSNRMEYKFFFERGEIKLKTSTSAIQAIASNKEVNRNYVEVEIEAKKWFEENLEEIENAMAIVNENEAEGILISEEGIFQTNENEKEIIENILGFKPEYIKYLINILDNENIESYNQNGNLYIPIDDE